MHTQILMPGRTWEKEGGVYTARYNGPARPLPSRYEPPPRYDRPPADWRPIRPPHRRRPPFPARPGALISVIGAGVSAGSTTGNNVSATGYNTTGASLITLATATYQPAGIGTVADSKSNTYVALTSFGDSASLVVVTIYYANASTGTFTVGTGHDFTCSTSASFPSIGALAWAGATSANPLDQQSGNFSTSGVSLSPTSPITPAANNYLFFTALGLSAVQGSTPTIDGSFITPMVLFVDLVASQHFGLALSYQIQTTATARQPSAAWAASTGNAMGIADFKVAAGDTFAGIPAQVSQPSQHYRPDLVPVER